jgi:Rne/Rng family ribonuclease
MVKRMLIEATHPEETRVVVLDGTRLEEFDVETSTKKQIKGNIYLAKVVRVEPSLQAAFVDYGGNRHGFLAFSEMHRETANTIIMITTATTSTATVTMETMHMIRTARLIMITKATTAMPSRSRSFRRL